MIKVIVGKVAAKPIAIKPHELLVLAATPALFGAQTFVYGNSLTGEGGEQILEMVGELQKSTHTFVFEEEKLLKKETDILTKAGVKVEIKKEQKKDWKFDQFGITTALGAKDKKKLWLGLTLALRAGEKPEALAGLMAWKARQLKNVQLSRELTYMYHDSHRGVGDLALLLERFALKL